jgi:hypothetical protein
MRIVYIILNWYSGPGRLHWLDKYWKEEKMYFS